jgi:uncharacterized membrane protein required for colicin V production
MDGILEFLQNTPITDWFLLIFAILFALIGFFRGGAKILIHSAWVIAGFLIASGFYQNLTNLQILDTFNTK